MCAVSLPRVIYMRTSDNSNKILGSLRVWIIASILYYTAILSFYQPTASINECIDDNRPDSVTKQDDRTCQAWSHFKTQMYWRFCFDTPCLQWFAGRTVQRNVELHGCCRSQLATDCAPVCTRDPLRSEESPAHTPQAAGQPHSEAISFDNLFWLCVLS